MATTPATKHIHHFEDLSPDGFERLVYWLVKRSGDFDEVQWYGGARDKGRDVVAYKHNPAGREMWYIQCKRYKSIAFPTLRDELDKLAKHAKESPGFAPAVVVFATACPVPPQAKDLTTAHARTLALPEPYYWGRLELDERLKAQPDTEDEFFGLGTLASKPFDVRKRPIYAVVGLLVGASVDLFLNLLAAAIQQRAFADQFGVSAISWLAGLSVVGLLLGYWLGGAALVRVPTSVHSQVNVPDTPQAITITRLRALLSSAKLRGRGISIFDTMLIGSRLDVKTHTEAED